MCVNECDVFLFRRCKMVTRRQFFAECSFSFSCLYLLGYLLFLFLCSTSCFVLRVGANGRKGNQNTAWCCLNVGVSLCRYIDLYFVLQRGLLMSSTCWLMLKYTLRIEMIEATIALSTYVLFLRLVGEKSRINVVGWRTTNAFVNYIFMLLLSSERKTFDCPERISKKNDLMLSSLLTVNAVYLF